jgi:hypothetical protein
MNDARNVTQDRQQDVDQDLNRIRDQGRRQEVAGGLR